MLEFSFLQVQLPADISRQHGLQLGTYTYLELIIMNTCRIETFIEIVDQTISIYLLPVIKNGVAQFIYTRRAIIIKES